MDKKIKVICAIIESEEKVLVVQRSANMNLPLKWEFPGGKIEKEESEQECIIREIMEELNIEIELIKKLTSSFYNYPHITVELIPYIARYLYGEITLIEHNRFCLLRKEELMKLDWAEADIPIVKEYLNL